jgi:hypothetical protein
MGEKLLLLGPNRHCEQTVYEQQFVFAPVELEALADRLPAMYARLADTAPFSSNGFVELIQPALASGEPPLTAFAQTLNSMALVLQRSAGHRVQQHGCAPDTVGSLSQSLQTCFVWQNPRRA